MPVRSPHEPPALTLEMLRAFPEDEEQLTVVILEGWLARWGHQLDGEVPPSVVARLAAGVFDGLAANGLCPRCASALCDGELREVLVTCLVVAMMQGAEVLRCHQLAHEEGAGDA